MQTEILTANPASRIRILGINQTGQEASNDLAVAGRSPFGWGRWILLGKFLKKRTLKQV